MGNDVPYVTTKNLACEILRLPAGRISDTVPFRRSAIPRRVALGGEHSSPLKQKRQLHEHFSSYNCRILKRLISSHTTQLLHAQIPIFPHFESQIPHKTEAALPCR